MTGGCRENDRRTVPRSKYSLACFRLYDRLYRWEGANRYRAYWRSFLTAGLFVTPGIASLITLSVLGARAHPMITGTLTVVWWSSMAALFGWMIYSVLRTLRAVWAAIRGKPHDLERWREP